MPKYRAYYTATASAYVEFETDDDADLYAAADDAVAESGLPSLCASCSGWGKRDSGIEIGDWEPADEKFGPNVVPVDE